MAVMVYLEGAALANVVAYLLINKRWRRRERARFIVGVLCVLLPALLVAAFGFFDLITALVIFAGFAVAGLLTLAMDIESETTIAGILREGFGDAESD